MKLGKTATALLASAQDLSRYEPGRVSFDGRRALDAARKLEALGHGTCIAWNYTYQRGGCYSKKQIGIGGVFVLDGYLTESEIAKKQAEAEEKNRWTA